MRKALSLVVVVAVSSLILTKAIADVPSIRLVEGQFASDMYEQQKEHFQTLSQKNIAFTLHSPGNADQVKPEVITAKVGEVFFIKNDEISVAHNVYDETDTSWVLKKQDPGSIAAVAFLKPGEHHFLCAFHPQMKITVNVVPQ